MYIQRGAPQAAIGRQIPYHQSEGVDAPLCEGRCGQPRLDTFSVMGGLCGVSTTARLRKSAIGTCKYDEKKWQQNERGG
jgi:hypothetical protein